MSAAAGDGAMAIALYASILEDNIKSEEMVADAVAWLVEACAPQYRDAIAKARVVSLVVRASTVHKESARIAGSAAAVLARLVPDEVHRKQFLEAGGIALVVSILTAHCRVTDVAAATANIVTVLTRSAAGVASLTPAVVAISRPLVASLRALTADLSAAVPLCTAVAALCFDVGQPARDAVGAAGGLAVVMAVARAHQHVETMAVPLSNALFSLSHGEGPRAAAVEAGIIPVMVGLLKDFITDPDVAHACCYGLRNISVNHDAFRAAIGAAGGVEQVVNALKTHLRNATLAEDGVSALATLSADSGNRARIAAAGGVAQLLAAFKRHASVSELVACACNVIANMTAFSAEAGGPAVETPVATDGIPLLMDALRMHSSSDRVVKFASLALGHMSRYPIQKTIVKADGVPLLVKTLQTAIRDPWALAQLCCTLRHIAHDSAGLRAIVAAGGAKQLVAVWKAHFRDAKVLQQVVQALARIACIDGSRPTPDLDAVALAPLVVESLKAHASECCLGFFIISLLGPLTATERAQLAFAAAGAVPLVVVALQVPSPHGHDMAMVCNAVAQLSSPARNRAAVVAAGGITRLVACVKEFAGSAPALIASLKALVFLSASDESTQAAIIKAGGVPPVVSALQAHPFDDDMLFSAPMLLAALTSHPEPRRAVFSVACVKALSLVLGRATDGAHVRAACIALGNLCSNDAFRLSSTTTCGAALNPAVSLELDASRTAAVASTVAERRNGQAVLELLREVAATEADLCCCGPLRLLNLLTASDSRFAVFDAFMGSLGAVLDFAAAGVCGCHVGRLHAFGTLFHAHDDDRLRKDLLARGIFARLTPTLRPSARTVEQDQQALVALAVLVRFTSSSDGQLNAVRQGAVRGLLRLLPAASSEPPAPLEGAGGRGPAVTALVAKALANVLQAIGTVGTAEASGDVAARAVQLLHPGNPAAVLGSACALLRAYAMGDGCERAIVAAGGAPALVAVLRAHASDAEVAEQACGALWNTVGVEDAAVHAAAAGAGAVPALQTVVAAHGASSPAGRMALGALAILS